MSPIFYFIISIAIVAGVYYVITTWLPTVPVQGEGTHLHAKVIDNYNHPILLYKQGLLHFSDNEWTMTTDVKGRLHIPLELPFDDITIGSDGMICVSSDHLRCGEFDDDHRFRTTVENMKQKPGVPIPQQLFLHSVYPWSIGNQKQELTFGSFNARPLEFPTNWIELDDDHYLMAATYQDKSIFLDKLRAVFIKVDRNTYCPVSYSEPICLDSGCKAIQKITSLSMIEDDVFFTIQENDSYSLLTIDSDSIRSVLL